MGKEIVVIGDRILISPDTEKSRTETGLFLPQGLAEKEKIQSGYVVKIGPGYIIPEGDSSEPWRKTSGTAKYIPLQVRPGDFAIFLRKESVEIEYEEKKYLIVSQSGVLAVVREELKTENGDEI